MGKFLTRRDPGEKPTMTRSGGGPVFVALVNPKSGGNMGNQLLQRFKEILDEERVYNLSEGGPEKALAEHRGTENLRIIGKTEKNNDIFLKKT